MKPLDHRALRNARDAGGPPPRRRGREGESEDFRAILDSIPQMVWAHLPGSARHEYYNRRWLDFTGVALALDGSTRRRLIHPDGREGAMAAWARALATGEPYRAEYRLRHRSGEYRWILSQGRPDRDAAGEIVRWYGTCTDIHEQVLAREALNASEALNRSILDSSADCIKMLGPRGRIRFLNEAARRELAARGVASPLGCEWLETLPDESRPLARAALARALEGRAARFTTIRNLAGNRNEWRDYAVTPILAEGSEATGFVVSSRDVTDERAVQEQLRWTSNHDALTHLPNRAFFHECLQEAIRQARPAGRHVGLLIVDVDHLKQVNDALGHAAGDALIRGFAERLRSAVPPSDVVGRLGGDEFGILLTGLGAKAEIAAAADAVMTRLREPLIHDGRLLDCRGSAGAAVHPEQGEGADELMKHADLALYAAKAAGRGRWLVFDPAMRAELQTRTSMLSIARDALADGRVFPFYQPKVDLRTGAVAGFEALLRWRDGTGRIHAPATIAAAFEDSDLALAISEAIVAGALADMAEWREGCLAFGHVAINVSAVDFHAPDFAERLISRLERAGLPPSSLQIEVTETVFLGRGAENVETALKKLSAAGIRIALDDFGTGFASLSHLKRFPVDVLKIDRSFVRNLAKSPEDAAIIRGVIDLSRNLGIDVVAEGVETQVQRRFLADHGCDYGQGYLFARAVAAAEVPDLVAGWGFQGPRRRQSARRMRMLGKASGPIGTSIGATRTKPKAA